ncbi:amidase [Ornithinibacillus halotolerans]|uniref:Amidase n=1 Tax=Ornithinibacillus halotolerans TaxID=1274357 RepID=A0A916WB83_9BACI|nr:amidase [Ornithinibacillus halotolerans]GGA84785.1 amidase [Ornithinibacillus halotolerans]
MTTNFIEANVLELQQAMDSGKLTAKKLTLTFLEQIAKYNQAGPKLNAVLEINPEALFIAELLDIERKTKGSRGPLHGIPILIKDNIDTGDKMHTTAGSVALADHYAKEDAFIVKQLREAGAIILGKTNLTEWANFLTIGMPNGYSSLGGQVLNPYGPGEFDVGGSSAGTGSAIAANFAPLGIGTETSGSILSPASSNSLVGIKPTVGLISRTGVIPISSSQDTTGPMTRTVTDAAILLGALTASDSNDSATQTNPNRVTDYTKYLHPEGLEGKRIGVPQNYLEGIPEEELSLVEQAIEDMKNLGAIIVRSVELPSQFSNMHVMIHEFKNGINAYLKDVDPTLPVYSLLDVIQYNQTHASVALKYGQKIFLEAESKSGRLTETEYLRARLEDLRLSQQDGIDKAIAEEQLDALLFVNNYGASIAAKAGYPSITVPAGYTEEGKPVGVTFTGLAFSEPLLIELGYAYEQATNHRKTPNLD